ncbi:hypothetical protein P775_15265 [Puniceibacterium antarcticum]|uniref:VTT domain-containing protein n=2 Tax=Puniceibacterium antarcticum TaxID=1206336 RepID=A0A2G8RD78_9RHOB|nr:hypothetical protein P775_15265 [Puniceibacterium antarcticum]
MFLGYVSGYGLPVIFVATFLSCLAIPIPTFAVMLSGGAFAASGDLVLWQVVLAALCGAISGDQLGFQIGRSGGPAVLARLRQNPKRAKLLERARKGLARWGGVGVFFSTWMVAILGPWMNLTAGAVGMSRTRFTACDAAGEAVWVTIYVVLGYVFGANLGELVEIVSDWAGLVTSAAITLVLGAVVLQRMRRRHLDDMD